MGEVEMILDGMSKDIEKYEAMRKAGYLLDESELAAGYAMRGSVFFQVGNMKESIEDFTRCIEIFERLIEKSLSPRVSTLAEAYAGRAMVYHVVGMNEEALPDITKSIEIWEGLERSGQSINEAALFNLYMIGGGIRNYLDNYMDEAISDYKKGIKIAEKIKKTGNPFDDGALATVYMGMAQSYDQKEEFGKANEYYSVCIDIWHGLGGGVDEIGEENLGNLATAYMNRGINRSILEEYDTALADYNKSVEIRESLKKTGVWQDALDVSMSYKNRALAYFDIDNLEAAIKDYDSAINVLIKELDERPELQEVYNEYFDELKDMVENNGLDDVYGTLVRGFEKYRA